MSMYDVSVVVAVKNEQRHVEEAILSILRQKNLRFELIVVDDNSSDDTLSILTDLATRHADMLVFCNPASGKCSAFNYGVARARGAYVCIFAGDDIMPEGALAARWGKVKDFPKDAAVVGLCKLLTLSTTKRFDGHLVPRRPGRGGFTGVSYLMSRAVVANIFPVPETLPNEDTWMELAVTHFPGWQLIHSDIVGCVWRVHEGNSINMLVSFDEYNRKLKPRMSAIPMFYEQYGTKLTEQSKQWLRGKVECEKSREAGSIYGVMTSKVGFVERLRALSTVNRFFYGLRKRLFGLLSGW